MKKFICILTAAVLLFCMGGCGTADTEADTKGQDERPSEGETGIHKIGVAVYDVYDDEVVAFRDYLTGYIKECFPEVEFCYTDSIRSEEDEMQFLEAACAEGVEGILSFITYNLSREVEYCESQGVYYMLALSHIHI